MSGGIDSAVSAILLQDQGYEVLGAHMVLAAEGQDPLGLSGGCFGPQDPSHQNMLRRTCEQLGIELHSVNLRSDFDAAVLDYYRTTYLRGRTPNPCVVCNQQLKFSLLPHRMKDLGLQYNYFATGHYARVVQAEGSGRWQLLQGADLLKDQSYFLCLLSQEQLSHTLFPLGGLTKAQVREIALQRDLEYLLAKAESQDFLSAEDHPRLFDPSRSEPGDLVDPQGRVVGRHRGLIHYTIGQRRHLGLSGMPEPWYVIALDPVHNRVSVGPQNLLYQSRLTARNVNWVSVPPLSEATRAKTRIRLAHAPAACTLKPLDDSDVRVEFDAPQQAVTPGQFAVFYQEDTLLGGGVIT